MAPDLLARAHRHIVDDLPNVYCLLVVQHGSTLFEEYYQGHLSTDAFGVLSVTKSVVSALVGIALKEQRLTSLDAPLASLLPAYLAGEADPRKLGITIRHLLTMTAGLAWDEDELGRLVASDDWVRFVLDLPMEASPGTAFNYNSGLSHVLSALIGRATGESVLEYATRALFVPLGISTAEWETDPRGLHVGGWGLYMTARDLAAFGRLYLGRGWWEGREIVPEGYVEASTRPSSSGGFPEESAYGYGWWVTQEAGLPAYFAAGYGGQYVYVVPALELVTVITSRYELPPQLTGDHRRLVTEFVVPGTSSD